MNNLNEIANEINNLRRSANENPDNYKKIIEIFSNQIHSEYSTKEISEKTNMVSDILMALYKLNKYEKGINFIEDYLKIDLSALEQFTVNMYGWCVYKLLKEIFKGVENWDDNDFEHSDDNLDDSIGTDLKSFYNRLKSIFNVLSITDEKYYLVIKMLLFSFLKIISKQAKLQWSLGYDLLSFFKPENFSKQTSTTEFNGRQKELASDFENWHAQKAKALFELGKFQECITFSNEVLNKGILKHYDYDIWFKRRIGLCHYKLNDLNKALSYLSEVIKYKKDWFIQKDIAEIFYELGEYEKALKYAIDAALNRGEQKYKCDLYILLYKILKNTPDQEVALKHLQLAAAIKIKEEWKLGETLSNYLSENKLSAEGIDFKLLEKELKLFYHSKLKTGTLQKINPQSKIGFINSNGSSIFFRFNAFSGSPSKIKDNIEVYFSDDISYDRKRNQDSIAAIYLCIKNN